MEKRIEKRLPLVAISFLSLLSAAGCADNSAHNGLAPDISGPETLNAGTTDSYSISASSETDYPLAYGINWGDGSNPLIATNVESGESVSGNHVWANPGTYTVTATATDGHGSSGFSSYTVQVTAPPPPPPPEQQESVPPETLAAAPEEPPVPVPQKPAPPLTVIVSDDPLPQLPPSTEPLKMVNVPPPSAVPAASQSLPRPAAVPAQNLESSPSAPDSTSPVPPPSSVPAIQAPSSPGTATLSTTPPQHSYPYKPVF